ncbi:MAG: hypothetical protein HUU20_15320 [Pirellulales bacterium]|nr:hypothetical protein [Pirellulales bacterium]
MTPLLRFWTEQHGIRRPLETDTWGRHVLNRYVVAALMNTFPVAATRIFSMSRGELARLLFVQREGGSFRVLRTMYDYENPDLRGDLLNRLLMQSPAVKAARNRRTIAQKLLQTCLAAQPQGVPALVLAIGGGDGSLEVEVIARAGRPDVYYCGVDKDERAAEEIGLVLKRHGLDGKGFVYLGNVAEKSDMESVLDAAREHFGIPFEGARIAVCHGIAEYLDIGSHSNETLAKLLGAIHHCTRPEGNLIISQTDYHDRVAFLELGLAWHMRLRSSEELSAEIEKAGWRISVCEHEPMRLISMCLAVKPDAQHVRVDASRRANRSHETSPRRRRALWRLWTRSQR